MDEFIQTGETRFALKLVRQGKSFFITGRAGTGKTMLLKKIVSECRARGKNVVVTAPTGVAAKNAEGQTIHSLFRLKTSVFIPNKMRMSYRLDSAREKVVKNLDVLIIDEISMVRGDLLDMVNLTLQHYKGNKKPFGGIQVLFFGDLFQLPPVVTDEEEDLFCSYYDNEFFFSSDVIRKHPVKVLELMTVFRQKEDADFVNILNNIREGKYLDSDRTALNRRWVPGYEPSDKESAVYLRTLRRKVWGYNISKLEELSGKEIPFTAYIEGDFPIQLYPTDYELRLKVGAKVMLLRNDNDGKKYVNGTLGTISSILGDEIRVKTDEGLLITVDRTKWERYKYVYEEESKTIVPVPIGSFRQFPLMLAWAVTIHKSQGMTFDKAIVDARRSFAPGQVYVALSRCRSLKGLTLSSKISGSDIMVNPIVVEYMKTVERLNPNNEDKETDQQEEIIFFFSDNGKTITGISSEVYGDIKIPDGVEKIAEKAFEENTNITSVVFPDSLREIGDHAFWGCKNLNMVKFNEGLTRIGLEAFIETLLQEVELPETLEELGLTPFDCKMKVDILNDNYSSDINGVLYNADETSLILYPRKVHEETIEVPDCVTCIESYAFENNEATEIILPEGTEELLNELFSGCQNLVTLTIKSYSPKNIEVDEDAFKGFEVENCVLRVPFAALAEYKDDERFKNFKYITAIEGSRCLMYEETGTEVIGCDDEDCAALEIPNGVTSIKESAFKDKKIVSVILPKSLLDIGHSAFAGCVYLFDIELKEGLKTISWDAFRGSGLSHVLIPCSVENIGVSAFNCEIEVDNNNTDFCAYDGVLYSFDEKELVIYPTDKEDEEFEVPFTVEEINSFAFEDTNLKSLTLPDSIKYLGRDIFSSESKLETLILQVPNPNEMEINEKAFESFNKQQCKLIVPDGSLTLYASHKHFKDFMLISEMTEQDGDDVTESEFSIGQYFEKLPGSKCSMSKVFFHYDGCYRCYIVLSSKGFFLKLIDGGYYYLSNLINGSVWGQVWVLNKRDTLSDYMVAYSTDNKTKKSFGHFYENPLEKTLSYTDLQSEKSFVVAIKTGKVINPQQKNDNQDFFTQENLKSFYPGVSVSGFYKTVYQIFDELPEVDYNIISITPNTKKAMAIQYSEILEEEFMVVGLRHHDYYNQFTQIAEGISEGDNLELRNEPDNPVDNNAIAVYYKDKIVGYISKDETEDVHELMALNDDYRFYISSKPVDSFKAVFSTNARVNRSVKKKYHVNIVAEAELYMLTDEIIDRYSTYINALIGHDIIFRPGYNNQMDVEASRHRFIGRLYSLYFNKRAEQGQIDGKIIRFNIKDDRIAQIDLEIVYDEYEPRACYKKLVDGITVYFKELEIGKTYDISLEEINAIDGKKKKSYQYTPFIKYLQDYYQIVLNIRD